MPVSAHPLHAFGLLAAALAMACPPAQAAEFGGIKVPPPPPAGQAVDTYWGQQVSDPYRALEDTEAPAVAAWMKAQAETTDAIMARIPGRAALLARIQDIESRAAGLAIAAVRTENGRIFFQRRDPGDNQFRLVYRDAPDGADTLIFDPELVSKQTGKTHALMDFKPSPDGRAIAYSVQAGGGEIGVLHVIDLASGKPLMAPVDRIRYADVNWLEDGSGFFFSRLREGYQAMARTEMFGDRTVHFRNLVDDGPDRPVFSASRAPELKLPIYADGRLMQIPGSRRVLNTVNLGVERHVLLYSAELADVLAGKPTWTAIAGAADKIASVAMAPGGELYLRSSQGAPRFQVLKLAAGQTDIAKAEVVVAASEGVITKIAASADALYVVRRDGATQQLWQRPFKAEGRPQRVALPFEGSVSITGASHRRTDLLLLLGGWTHATKPWRVDGASGKAQPLPLVAPGAFDASTDIVAREMRVKSHDGVEVPLSVLSRKGALLDGSLPTIVYGYGAYGSTDDPFFNPRIYAWLARGGVYAIAHVRGGGAFGEEWHLAGRKASKPNTWKDAIAAAEWLIANGYTNKSRIGVYGGSAGGILVGRAITERPDLFAAAVPAVGVMDMLRSELRANGVANIPEYGTVKKEDEFHALRAMSTYAHIAPGTAYPGLMFVHGVNDIRVPVSESLKAGARFAAATHSGRPVLQRLEYDSGHGQGSSRAQLQQRTADIWSFFLWQFGVPEFQPQP